jgi:hypothetical protein
MQASIPGHHLLVVFSQSRNIARGQFNIIVRRGFCERALEFFKQGYPSRFGTNVIQQLNEKPWAKAKKTNLI